MRSFEHPNMTNFVCPICKTSEDKPVTLVGISGTENDGIVEARQYHVDCIDLVEIKIGEEIYLIQKIK
jgi:hypothetical protein